MHHQLAKGEKEEKATPFGVNLMRSRVLYRAAQELAKDSFCKGKLLYLTQSIFQAMQTLSRTSKGCFVNKLKH